MIMKLRFSVNNVTRPKILTKSYSKDILQRFVRYIRWFKPKNNFYIQSHLWKFWSFTVTSIF